MTITLTDPSEIRQATSLNSALARAAALRASAGPGSNSPYGSVRVRMTVRNGRITDVVAV